MESAVSLFYLVCGIIALASSVLAVKTFVRGYRAHVLEKQHAWAKHLENIGRECGEAALLHQLRRKRAEFMLTEPEQSVLSTLESVFGP
jgi:hypothetical protein